MKNIIAFFFALVIYQSLFSNEINLIGKINNYRTDQGLNSLVIEDSLSITAHKYALELIEEGRLNHIDNNGGRVLNRYRASGGTAVKAGEILGTSTDLQHIFDAWKESPSHNRLMKNDKWQRIGSAVIEDQGNLVALVLFSNSLVETVIIENYDEHVTVLIKSINKWKLHFPLSFNSEEILSEPDDSITYFFRFELSELPVLIPVSGEFGGKNKMSDFLYIR